MLGIFLQVSRCRSVPFLAAKKGTKEGGLRRRYEKSALLKNPPAASPSDTGKCSDFPVSAGRKLGYWLERRH